MSEQKHTPYYYVDTQLGDRYCLMDGNDMSKDGAYRMLEEIKKVAEITKENERLKEALSEIRHALYDRGTDDAILDCIAKLRNKVIELEQTIRKIQDKAIELYGNQIELP